MPAAKQLSFEELKAVIGEVIEKKARESLADPDATLGLRPEVLRRLRKDLRAPRQDGEKILGREIAGRRGIEW